MAKKPEEVLAEKLNALKALAKTLEETRKRAEKETEVYERKYKAFQPDKVKPGHCPGGFSPLIAKIRQWFGSISFR